MTYNETPKIYLACLASYNNGILHGVWVEANQGEDHILEALQNMLTCSPITGAEEWAIHDYEGFHDLSIAEYASFENLCAQAAFIENHGALGAALASYYDGDIAQACTAMEEQYCGAYDSLTDYAQQFYEDCGMLSDIPEYLARYIDFEAIGRDMDISGDIFTIEHDGQCHVFHAYA